jgi:hypothetical protein
MLNHLRLVTSVLDVEVDKNKTLATRVTTLERAAKEAQDKYISKVEEFESKWIAFQGVFTYAFVIFVVVYCSICF